MPYDKDESYFVGYINSSTSDLILVPKIKSKFLTRLEISYCQVNPGEKMIKNGCKKYLNKFKKTIKSIQILPNSTFIKILNKNLKNYKNYDFFVSGDYFSGSSWFSTGIMPIVCIYDNKNIVFGKNHK